MRRRRRAETVIAEGQQRLRKEWTWMMLRAAARAADRLGSHDEAIRRWDALREQFPAKPAGFLEGAEALARAGRSEGAAALIRQARDFFPGNKTIAAAAARLVPRETPEAAQPPTSPRAR
jgi:Flp pilus assembly protein TadD